MRWLNLMAAMLVLSAASSCRTGRPGTGLQVGIIAPAFNHLPLAVAEAERGSGALSIVYQRFNSGWELGEALVAGKVDAAIIPFTYVVSAQARGSDVRIVACFEHEDDGIIARPGIERLEELEGRKVGCLKASTIELLLRRTLDDRGIRSELVYFSSPMEMWAALEHRDVDALSYYVPGIIKAQGKLGNIIHWYSADWPLHPCCDVAVHVGRTRGKRDAVRQFLAVLRTGTELIAQDTTLAAAVASRAYNLSDAEAIECLRHTPFRLGLSPQETEFEMSMAELMLTSGYIPKPADPARLYLPHMVNPDR